MEGLQEIRGLIYGKYRFQGQLADVLGWSKQKLSKIVSGAQEPTLREITSLADALDVSVDRMVHIFLKCWSPNG